VLFKRAAEGVHIPMKPNLLFCLLCAACFCGCATGGGEIENRILRLERQNSMLEKQLMASESRLQEQLDINDQLRTVSAELYATMDSLRMDIQGLTGKVEEVDFSIQSGSRSINEAEDEIAGRINRVDEIARSNKDRIAAVEQYLDFEMTPVDTGEEADTATASDQPLTDRDYSETELYTTGKRAFDNGQYEIAREQFKQLLSQYPKSDNADNAQFWVGEIYYREKWYAEAIMEYQKVIENYPDGNKVPAALYKQGLSFYNLEDETNARFFLQEVINKYPTSNEAKAAREKLQTF
jgi:tol-pal system protein YbgF